MGCFTSTLMQSFPALMATKVRPDHARERWRPAPGWGAVRAVDVVGCPATMVVSDSPGVSVGDVEAAARFSTVESRESLKPEALQNRACIECERASRMLGGKGG